MLWCLVIFFSGVFNIPNLWFLTLSWLFSVLLLKSKAFYKGHYCNRCCYCKKWFDKIQSTVHLLVQILYSNPFFKYHFLMAIPIKSSVYLPIKDITSKIRRCDGLNSRNSFKKKWKIANYTQKYFLFKNKKPITYTTKSLFLINTIYYDFITKSSEKRRKN